MSLLQASLYRFTAQQSRQLIKPTPRPQPPQLTYLELNFKRQPLKVHKLLTQPTQLQLVRMQKQNYMKFQKGKESRIQQLCLKLDRHIELMTPKIQSQQNNNRYFSSKGNQSRVRRIKTQTIETNKNSHLSFDQSRQKRILAIDKLNTKIRGMLNSYSLQKEVGKIKRLHDIRNCDSRTYCNRTSQPKQKLYREIQGSFICKQSRNSTISSIKPRIQLHQSRTPLNSLQNLQILTPKNYESKFVNSQFRQKVKTGSSAKENSYTRRPMLNRFYQAVSRQIQLDQRLRDQKRSLSLQQSRSPEILTIIKRSLDQHLMNLPLQVLKEELTFSSEEYDPFVTTCREFSVDRLVRDYLQSQNHYHQHIYKSLNQEQFRSFSDKFMKEGRIQLQHFVSCLNLQLRAEHRNRDLFILSRRLGGKNLSFQRLREALLKQH